ncbi:MAG: cation:proton antiporter [Candidatus Thermofonsia Clade 1 bacterium]|jgi:multicomponent Na+:H+ antiporter subunit C|uniref:Cation:proton antiporter n=1 Tax=Candidatus Thermofonsia Clade 1 bacterium TaxID=2364210 RepID=A0A2M8PCD4_9CHLR|nr:MAG: cation:proton antiporter [Candidatus Thermofonsia Clade 1 bacterium]RMF52182.1 MAG: cation:proton antiporter [Chloroflexota bacterium]
MSVLFAVATGIMFGMGIYQLLRRDLIKAAFGFYILFTAINLFLLASGAFEGVMPAYVDEQNRTLGTTSDPLVQALILTAIVISFGTYTLLLSFIVLASRRFKTVDSDEIDDLIG